MEQKKLTRAQLESRIKKAIVFVPKDKDTNSIFFSDRGLRLTITSDKAIIGTNYHYHVFDNMTMGGISRPWLYTKRLIEIASENDCKNEDGYSLTKLLETLNKKEDKLEYNLVTYICWWLELIFSYLYAIGESEIESFLVYEAYLHHIARQTVLLSEKTNDMTNIQFFDKVCDNMKEFMKDVDERVIFKKKSDEELIQENIDAIQEQEVENFVKEDDNNGGENKETK